VNEVICVVEFIDNKGVVLVFVAGFCPSRGVVIEPKFAVLCASLFCL
jgi:hypothetical protein